MNSRDGVAANGIHFAGTHLVEGFADGCEPCLRLAAGGWFLFVGLIPSAGGKIPGALALVEAGDCFGAVHHGFEKV